MGIPGKVYAHMENFLVRTLNKKYSMAQLRWIHLPYLDLDVFDYFTGGDYGDCPIQNGNYEFTFKILEKCILKFFGK